MEELVIVLLKLLVQVVLYAFTGKWHRFDETADSAPPSPQPRQRARTRSPKQPPALPDLLDPRAGREALRRALEARLRGATSSGEEAPWFTFPDEYVEREPQDEAVGGEAASQPTLRRQEPMRAQLPDKPARGAPRSIARAVRDRRTLRYAVVVGAALGPRGTRR